jgi:hypothetical protein
MSKSVTKSAVLIGVMVLSFDAKLHRQFASTAPTPFDTQRSIFGPPAFAKMVFYMYKSFPESPLLIGLTLLSFE